METATTSSEELPGFEKVDLNNLSEETLTIEDLESSKKQLWLIKVPYEFDISSLSDSTIILNGAQELPTKKSDKNIQKRYETRASKYKDKQSCPFDVVVPSRKGNCFKVAKDFTGHLDIMQTVKVPMLVYPPTPPPMYTEVPKGLQARWKPFGHGTPLVIQNKLNGEREDNTIKRSSMVKKKKKERVKRTRDASEEEKETEKQSPKKKKKRKEPEELPEIPRKDKHKKKKNK